MTADDTLLFTTLASGSIMCEYNNIVTLVSFLIYKERLVLSLEGKSRNSNNIVLQYFKNELLTRLKIYELCSKFSIKDIVNIDALIESL